MKIKEEDASEDGGSAGDHVHQGADLDAKEVKPILLTHIKGRN